MKKLLAILVLGLLWCNVSFSEFEPIEEMKGLNYFLKKSYKITNEETLKSGNGNFGIKIFTLIKGNSIVVCTIQWRSTGSLSDTYCVKP